jgi:pimeloyl-ACP methyl ester carboxylesterase
MRTVSRRAALITGVAALAGAGGGFSMVEAGVLPGRYRLAPYLGRCGDMPSLPRVQPGAVREFTSKAGRTVIGLPPGAAKDLPVVVMLHGSAGDARTPFNVYGVHYYLADAVRRGTPPFAVAAVDEWAAPDGKPSPALTRDLLPFLAERGLRTRRIGVLGWSIGGWGALWYAAGLGSGRVGAVAAASPALSQSDTTALPVGLKDIPASLTCGRDDPLSDPTAKLLARLRGRQAEATGGIYAGCHDSAFRRRMLPAQIAFLGRHLH